MSKIEQIEAFISVVEENSFAAAARRLGVSTPAISRQIARLESSLNAQLLKRTTRQITLTEVGSQYFQYCKKALSELSEAETVIAAGQSEAVGTLSVLCSRYFATKHLIPQLAQFMALNPKLQVKLELAERFPNFAEENIDIVFGVSMEGPPELVRKQVAMTRYVLCASPDYLQKYGMPQTATDLKNHRYITHSMRVPSTVITFKNKKEIFIEPILWLNDSYAMRECAIQGMGIVKLHDYVVQDALNDKRLIEILPELQEPQLPMYLYYRQSRYLQAKVRRFIDFYTGKLS